MPEDVESNKSGQFSIPSARSTSEKAFEVQLASFKLVGDESKSPIRRKALPTNSASAANALESNNTGHQKPIDEHSVVTVVPSAGRVGSAPAKDGIAHKSGKVDCPYVPALTFRASMGEVNYQITNPAASGPLVVTLHGLNGTRATFQDLANVLEKFNYRTITFDLYGHGLSTCPKFNVCGMETYSPEFFVRQVDDLLEHLGLNNEKVIVIGFSMGCLIAASWADTHPDRTDRVVFISPAGMIEKKPTVLSILKCCQCYVPCFPLYVCRCCCSKERFISRFSPDEQASGSANLLWDRMMWQLFERKGVIPALMGCVLRMPMWSAETLFKRIGDLDFPILILWGARDAVVHVEGAPRVAECFKNAHLVIFMNASHLVLAELPRSSIATIATFLEFPRWAHMEDFQYLLPFDPLGSYRTPRRRHPDDMAQNEYFATLKWRPQHWIKLPTQSTKSKTSGECAYLSEGGTSRGSQGGEKTSPMDSDEKAPCNTPQPSAARNTLLGEQSLSEVNPTKDGYQVEDLASTMAAVSAWNK